MYIFFFLKRFFLLVFLSAIFYQIAEAQNRIAFPLKQSENHRYLTDQNNKPVFLNGDTPWSLGYKASMKEVRDYLQDRKQKGINALIIQITPSNLLFDTLTHGDLPNFYNEHVFVNRDIAKPNEAYFKHIDSVFALCNEMNFAILLAPLYEGCCEDGWKEILDADPQSVDKAFNYGKWVADRYKHLPNIIWIAGGDHKATPQAIACAKGIAAVDSIRLHTFHGDPGYTSPDGVPDAQWLTLNMVYTYYPALISERLRQYQVYALFFHLWQKKVAMPVVMGESVYEFERDETTQFLRRQAYWSLLSGASGHFFGNRDIWRMEKNWKKGLNTPGIHSMEVFGKFVNKIPWHNMEPDWPATLFVSGRGAFNNGSAPGGDEYATAAFSEEKNIAAIYIPTYRKVGVNMARFSSSVNAKWFDPFNGTYSLAAGSFLNKGVRYFTPPKQYNSQGFEDWVLILEP